MAVLQKMNTSGRFMYAKAMLIALIAIFAWMQVEKFFHLSAWSTTFYLILAIFTVLIIAVAFIRARLQTFEITDDGITSRTGILNVKTRFVPYNKIDSVHMSRNIFDRILLLGTLRVDTLGTVNEEIVMGDISSEHLEPALRAIQSRIHGGGGSEPVPPHRR